jgi:hypothetical protein
MKRVLLLFAVSVCAVAAETPLLPAFDQKTETPRLSLLDGAKTTPMPFDSDVDSDVKRLAAWFRSESKPERVISRMPVVRPRGDVDAHMPVIVADPRIDPKMVKRPSVETVK